MPSMPAGGQTLHDLRVMRACGADITDQWLAWCREQYAAGVVELDVFEATVAHILAGTPPPPAGLDVGEWVFPPPGRRRTSEARLIDFGSPKPAELRGRYGSDIGGIDFTVHGDPAKTPGHSRKRYEVWRLQWNGVWSRGYVTRWRWWARLVALEHSARGWFTYEVREAHDDAR